ncbi:MAG: alkylation response protein AidB-like acyl-CoA dehydrogenase [Verrucomicrobiales bacterium]|jgi:alkylation response protein AidB-like acyl-CoA dehydrogenase
MVMMVRSSCKRPLAALSGDGDRSRRCSVELVPRGVIEYRARMIDLRSQIDDALDVLLAEHDPSALSTQEFRGHQFDAGLGIIHFPKGRGGMGLSPSLQRDIEKRVVDAGRAPEDPVLFFRHLAGPTIEAHGSDAVKDRFLRPMYTGEEKWCQLFSEPGAGSDFAGLAAKAMRDGDEWVVNGQKVWNTLAHLAEWGMLVVRTDASLPKHKGMTYFALEMRSEGVEVRPLRQITGEAEFNEVYLTDVRIPDANRIGDVGEGWRAALTTLMNERTAIGGGTPKRGGGSIGELMSVWSELPADEQTATRREAVMKLWAKAEALRLTNIRGSQNRKIGNPGPEGSVAKTMFAELNKDVYALTVDLLGLAGQVGYDYTFRRPSTLDVTGSGSGARHAFLRARANSIEGGTSEIMRNILGEQVLGLPGEPRIDKDGPWIDVPRS